MSRVICLAFLIFFPPAADFGASGEMVKLRKLKVVEEEYRILTKKNPIEITAFGPANLKINTHILYPENLAEAKYILVLETEEGEKFYSFKTPASRTKDEKGRRYGKLRVINFPIPSGTHHLRLHLLSSEKETCAVKIILEKVKWEEVKPTLYKSLVTLKKNGNIFYYETPIRINLKGGEYKFLARLFQEKGEETMRVFIKKEGGEIIEKEFLVGLSPIVSSSKENVSRPKGFYLELPSGEYSIEVKTRGMVKVYEKR
ncbi:MAG: hypothetical protein ABIK99_05260 [candidate division WOR-3 bacterium]